MTIQRRFEPDPEALERVVEILCRLLVETSEDGVDRLTDEQSEAPESTCVSAEAEG